MNVEIKVRSCEKIIRITKFVHTFSQKTLRMYWRMLWVMKWKRIRFGVTNKLNSIVYLWQGGNSCRAAKRSIPFIPCGNSCRAAKRLLLRRCWRRRKRTRPWRWSRNDFAHGVRRIWIIENGDVLQVDRVKMDTLLRPGVWLPLSQNWFKRRRNRKNRRRNRRSGGWLSHTSHSHSTECCMELGDSRTNLLRGERGER